MVVQVGAGTPTWQAPTHTRTAPAHTHDCSRGPDREAESPARLGATSLPHKGRWWCWRSILLLLWLVMDGGGDDGGRRGSAGLTNTTYLAPPSSEMEQNFILILWIKNKRGCEYKHLILVKHVTSLINNVRTKTIKVIKPEKTKE